MIQRKIADAINQVKTKYPVIQITGPRQSGKTTLAQGLFGDYVYKNLENPDERRMAIDDPRGFLELGTGKRMIIDEIQEVPELASYIQVEVDAQKIPAQFIITGSQNFKISQTVSQSLAGRVAIFELLPFSFNEIARQKLAIEQVILNGFFPPVIDKHIKPTDFYRDYTNTYITRDVRQIKNIGDLSTFQRFLELVAGRVGQLVNLTSLANDTGISVKTVEHWLSILEASYLIVRLQPFFENTPKRLVKSPKIYFTDTGLVCYLLGINSVEELSKHFSYGALFENFLIIERLKSIYNQRLNQKLYFWRDNKGVEIDLVVSKGLEQELTEIKASKTFSPEFSKNLIQVQSVLKKKYQTTLSVVYQGDIEQEIHDVTLMNWIHYLETTSHSS